MLKKNHIDSIYSKDIKCITPKLHYRTFFSLSDLQGKKEINSTKTSLMFLCTPDLFEDDDVRSLRELQLF